MPAQQPTLKIEHDDQPDGVVDKVNAILGDIGLRFERIDDERAGQAIYMLSDQGCGDCKVAREHIAELENEIGYLKARMR